MSASDPVGETAARSTTRDNSAILYRSDGTVVKADPGSIVNRFEAVDASEDRFSNPLPELELPGFGSEYEDCGEDIPRFCADCGATHMVGRTCYRSRCPRCGKAWARDRGTDIAAKLEATRRYEEAKREGYAGYKIHHLSLSPPEEYATFSHEPLDRTVDVLKEVLDEMGVAAGVVFYHPYSGADGDDRGEWKGRLFNPDPDWEAVRSELEHRPHFHAVVVAKHVDGGHVTRAVEEQTGWVIERITKSGSDISIFGKYDLARVVTYCLSHTGLEEKADGSYRAAYRYFGRTANLPATDAIQAEMDAAVRSVAPRTLDLEWSSLACVEDREDREAQSMLVASTAAAFDSGGDGGGLPADDPSADAPDGKCAGRLLDICKAPRFLEDEEWVEAAPHADELAEVWEEWRDDIDGDRPPPD